MPLLVGVNAAKETSKEAPGAIEGIVCELRKVLAPVIPKPTDILERAPILEFFTTAVITSLKPANLEFFPKALTSETDSSLVAVF